MAIINEPAPVEVPPVFVDCVRESIIENFSTMFGIQPKVELSGGEVDGDTIIGIISLVGDLSCSLMLWLPRTTAIALALKFVGDQIDFEGPDMGDIVGELANIVAGDVISRLHDQGIKVAMSLPMVARGADIRFQWQSELPWSREKFTSSDGEFITKIITGWPRHWINRISGLITNVDDGQAHPQTS